VFHVMHQNGTCILGILAGIWPCGVITLLNELYISESKSQVYGAIHSFFQSNEDTLTDISKIVAIYNGMHYHVVITDNRVYLL
jgi:hypothetical protein